MRQFDLYRNTDTDTNKVYPYFVSVQQDLLDGLNTRVVIPLGYKKDLGKNLAANLCPVISIEGEQLALLSHQITTVPNSYLQQRVTNLEANRDQIVSALDFLITGI